MKRIASLALIATILVACEAGPRHASLAHQSTLETATRGLVLHETGSEGHAGMMGTNCPFETTSGTVTGDYPLPGSGEKVVDVGPHHLGLDSILLTLGDNLYVLNKDDDGFREESMNVPGLLTAQFADDGFVILQEQEQCEARWILGDADHSTPVGSCDPDAFAVSPVGVVYAGGDLEVGVDVTHYPGTHFEAEVPGNIVVYDRVSRVAYVAIEGESTLSAIESDGSLRWSITVPGIVREVEAGGDIGAAVVMAELESGAGMVMYFDGRTGERIAGSETTPSVPLGMAVSGDGSKVAMILEDQTHFYSVSVTGRAP